MSFCRTCGRTDGLDPQLNIPRDRCLKCYNLNPETLPLPMWLPLADFQEWVSIHMADQTGFIFLFERMHSMYNRLDRKCEDLQSTYETAVTELTTLKRERGGMLSEQERLTERMKGLIDENIELHNKIARDKEAAITGTSQALVECQKRLAASEKRSHELEVSLHRSEKKCEIYKKEWAMFHERCATGSSIQIGQAHEILSLGAECNSLKGKLDDLQQRYVKFQCDHEDLQGECDALLGERNALQESLDALQKNYDKLLEMQERRLEADTKLQSELKILQEEHDALQKAHKKLQEKDIALKEKRNALHEKRNALHEKRIALRSALHEKHDTLQIEHDALRKEHDALREKHDTLQFENDALEHEHGELKHERGELQNKYVAVYEQYLASRRECIEIQRKFETPQRDREALQRDHEALQRDYERLQRDHEALQRDYERLKRGAFPDAQSMSEVFAEVAALSVRDGADRNRLETDAPKSWVKVNDADADTDTDFSEVPGLHETAPGVDERRLEDLVKEVQEMKITLQQTGILALAALLNGRAQ